MKRGNINRSHLITLLEDSIESLDEVVAKGESLKRVSRVQDYLKDAVLWLDPQRVDQMADPR